MLCLFNSNICNKLFKSLISVGSVEVGLIYVIILFFVQIKNKYGVKQELSYKMLFFYQKLFTVGTSINNLHNKL